jgi:uncharacterized surface protein with fasciclin (FAS1) repeats
MVACGDDDTDSNTGGTGGTTASGGTAGSSSGGAATGGKGGTTAATGGAGGGGAGTGGSAGAAGTAGAAATADIVDTAIAAGKFTKLAAALTSAGLVETLKGPGPFTVFAPDDAAFDAFEKANPGVLAGLSKEALTSILTYHVVAGAAVTSKQLKNNQVFTTVSGSPVLVDTSSGVKLTDGVKAADATVTAADVTAKNGVIHVIDFIIQPPSKDIVETAVAAGTFKTLAGALDSAGLVPTLKGKGPFTVFAPTDDAFKGVTPPTGDALANLLKFHVVGAAAGSGDLSNGQELTTLDTATTTKLGVVIGSEVEIKDSTEVAAKVAPANILTKNGVIHVVNKVLLPK